MSSPQLPPPLLAAQLLERVDADFAEVHLAPRPIIDDRAQYYTGKKERKKRYERSRVLLLELVVDLDDGRGRVVGAVGLHRRCVCCVGAAQSLAAICISGAGFEMVMGEASAAVLVGGEGCVRERSALGAGLGSLTCSPLPNRLPPSAATHKYDPHAVRRLRHRPWLVLGEEMRPLQYALLWTRMPETTLGARRP